MRDETRDTDFFKFICIIYADRSTIYEKTYEMPILAILRFE